ncbi:MAG: YceI family protein [Candidatus Eisenbacteria bacterium]|nr:YceI family protein [Candidatus Eisenbacteria bacterium]
MALVALALTAPLASALGAELGLMPGSDLGLKGKSTLHAFEAKASKLDVTFHSDPAAWPAGVTGGEAVERVIRARGVTAMDVVVAVSGLRSGKDGLDKNMWKALLAEKHPEIRFAMQSYEVQDSAATGEMAITAKGPLTVAGVDRDITMAVVAHRDGETVKLHGSVALLMTQFGIKPPTMMLGAIKTADEITVEFDLVIGANGNAVTKAE